MKAKPDGVAKSDGSGGFSVGHLRVQSIEGATHNEQDVPGVQRHGIPPGVLAPPLLWHIHCGAL